MKGPVMRMKDIVECIVLINKVTSTMGVDQEVYVEGQYKGKGYAKADIDQLYAVKNKLVNDLLTYYRRYRVEYMFGDMWSTPVYKRVRNKYKVDIRTTRDDYYGLWRFTVKIGEKEYVFHMPAPLLRANKKKQMIVDRVFPRWSPEGREFKEISPIDYHEYMNDLLTLIEKYPEYFPNGIRMVAGAELDFEYRPEYDDYMSTTVDREHTVFMGKDDIVKIRTMIERSMTRAISIANKGEIENFIGLYKS